MPELPEVETIVRDLNKNILGRKIEDVWSDAEKIIKRPKKFSAFKKKLIGKKIERVKRRAKNILFGLSGEETLLVHQKMTGHFLYGNWVKNGKIWRPLQKGALGDPMNRFIHLIFWLDNGKQLVLSDLRKFSKVELWGTKELEKSKELQSLGPEPLEKSFNFEKFEKILKRKKGKIKKVLMDQTIIAGIGNIYSDEILWTAKIHPFQKTEELSKEAKKRIYNAMKDILRKAIKLKGDSMSDYRLISGEKGGYQEVQRVYRQEGKKCYRCGTIIKRIKIGGRSAHFCPKCQKT